MFRKQGFNRTLPLPAASASEEFNLATSMLYDLDVVGLNPNPNPNPYPKPNPNPNPSPSPNPSPDPNQVGAVLWGVALLICFACVGRLRTRARRAIAKVRVAARLGLP